MTTLSYDLRGFRVALHVPNDDARTTIAAIFRGFPVPADAVEGAAHYSLALDDDHRWRLTARGGGVHLADTLADAMISVEWRIFTDMLAHRKDLFHLHAAALLAPAGNSSIVIMGVSGSGKTTLTLGLMARGFLPYADDVVLLDPRTLRPQTLPRAFHIDARTRELVEQFPPSHAWDWYTLPQGYFLPQRWAEQSVPVRVMLFPSLQPDAPPRCTALSITDATMALLPFSTTLTQSPVLALNVASRLTAQARAYRLTTGDLEATVGMVTDLVADNRE